MSRKCIIEKYLHQLNFSDDKFIVMADDFKMIADLALKQLAISKTELPGWEYCIRCPEEHLCKYDWEHCPLKENEHET